MVSDMSTCTPYIAASAKELAARHGDAVAGFSVGSLGKAVQVEHISFDPAF